MSLIGGRSRWSLPFSEPAVWYPTLAALALEEMVEVPMAAAVVLGRILVARRRSGREADRDQTGQR